MSESVSQLKVGAALDGSFETVTQTVKTKLKELSSTAKDTGDKLGGMGDGTTQAAQKVEGAAKSLISSIQRTTAVMDSGARGSVEYYKALANQRGVDANVLKPYLDQLEAVKVKQAQASAAMLSGGQSLDKIGMSAAATANALRGVPAQFTDIVTSIQGGQAPLTVFLQQGGQLKDMFGGAGNAAKALGGYVLGLINPFTLVAAGVAAAGIAYMKGAAESEAYNKALILTGSAAGVTAGQLGKMAQAVSSATGGTVGAAADALAQLAGAGNIASAQFERVAAVAVQMEKTTGVAVAETVKQFAELGKDPLDASVKLNEKTKFLTLSIYEQIKALTEQGRTFEAGALAQKAYADAMDERFPKLIENLGIAERAWAGVGGAAKKAWDQFLNIGRTGDPIKEVAAELKSAQDRLSMLVSQAKAATGYDRVGANADVASQEAIVANLKKQADYSANIESSKGRSAAYAARQTKEVEAQLSFDKESDKYLSKAVQMQQAIAAAQERFAKVSQTPENLAKYAQEVEGIQKKFEESSKKSTKAIKENTDARRIQDERIRLSRALAIADGKAVEDANDAYKKMIDDLAKANDKYIESLNKSADSIAENVLKLNDEETALRISTEQNISLAQAIEGITIKRLEEKRVMELIGNNDAAAQAIAREIEQRKLLANAIDSKDAREAVVKSAADAAAEWKKTSDQINSTLTDALMRGFESGKGFARNLRDTVVNMFKTMVLRPIISAVMSPISGAITGAMGLSGAAQAGQAVSTGSSLLSAASMASSLAGIGSTIAGAVGTAIGSFTGGLVAANAATVTLLTGSAASAAAAATAAATAGGAAATAATAAATAGSTAAASLMAVAAPAAIAVAVLAAFGAFRTTKQTGTGISGTLGDDASLTGFNEMRKSGYLFGGPKYWDEIKAIDPLMAKALKADFTAIKAAATGAADALGLASTSVAGFNKAFRIEFTGDKTKDEALYNDLMSGVSEDLARTIIGGYKDTIATVIDEIISGGGGDSGDITYSQVSRQVKTSTYTPSEFARDGETASQTLQRLATSITLVNGTSDMLGNKLTEVGLKGAATASLLIDAFGGAERYAAQMGAYYQNFYTQEEQRAKLIENTSEAFTALGKTMPVLDGGARAAYRSMVELAAGQDMSVESNRTAYASLLALQGPMNELAPTFDSVAQAAKDAALEQAAWQTRLDIATGITTQREVEKAAALLAADNATDLIILSLYAFEDAQTATAKATAKATEASRTALQLTVTNTQTSINSLVAMYGDLAGAMLEISQPTKTLVDQWRTTTTELTTLTQGLAQALGELPEATALDRLKATLATLASATNGIANISDQIFGLQVGRGDQAAVSLLQGREASLGAELATSNDPGAVAAKLATTMLQRIKLQGQLADKVTNDALKTQFDAATTMAQLEKTNREKQIAAIRDQISAAETLTGVVSSMRGYLAELRFGNLSALNPGDQLSAAQGNYATLLAGAQGGDTKAMQDLQGGASNYLQEAQGYYGGATSQYAGIFQAVTSGLEQFGATPVTDITLLKDQLTALEKIEAANLTLQTVVTDTTELQINGLNTINTTLTNRESEARQDAADNKKAVQDQIAELKAIVAGQEAQIKQQAAIYEGLMDRLTTATTALENIDRTTTTTAAAPV